MNAIKSFAKKHPYLCAAVGSFALAVTIAGAIQIGVNLVKGEAPVSPQA